MTDRQPNPDAEGAQGAGLPLPNASHRGKGEQPAPPAPRTGFGPPMHSTDGGRGRPNDWQWRDELWGDSPTAPAMPEQVPGPADEWPPGWLRRLMRWSSR